MGNPYLKFGVLLLIIFVSACKPKQEIIQERDEYYYDGAIQFLNADDLYAAVDKAKLENKPLFVEFHTDWCLPCKIMSEEVFTDLSLATYMNGHFINYKINTEKGEGPNMKLLYGVEELPTHLFLDIKGNAFDRSTGGLTQSQLIDKAKKAFSEWEGFEYN